MKRALRTVTWQSLPGYNKAFRHPPVWDNQANDKYYHYVFISFLIYVCLHRAKYPHSTPPVLKGEIFTVNISESIHDFPYKWDITSNGHFSCSIILYFQVFLDVWIMNLRVWWFFFFFNVFIDLPNEYKYKIVIPSAKRKAGCHLTLSNTFRVVCSVCILQSLNQFVEQFFWLHFMHYVNTIHHKWAAGRITGCNGPLPALGLHLLPVAPGTTPNPILAAQGSPKHPGSRWRHSPLQRLPSGVHTTSTLQGISKQGRNAPQEQGAASTTEHVP